jgi:hypothetical protein
MNRTSVVSGNTTARNLYLAADCSHGKDADYGSKDDRQFGKVCPERKLAVAVFSQAANDLWKFRHARRGAAIRFMPMRATGSHLTIASGRTHS